MYVNEFYIRYAMRAKMDLAVFCPSKSNVHVYIVAMQ